MIVGKSLKNIIYKKLLLLSADISQNPIENYIANILTALER